MVFGNDPGILEMLTSTAPSIMLMLRMSILYILCKEGACYENIEVLTSISKHDSDS
jgi:hypothetical protein